MLRITLIVNPKWNLFHVGKHMEWRFVFPSNNTPFVFIQDGCSYCPLCVCLSKPSLKLYFYQKKAQTFDRRDGQQPGRLIKTNYHFPGKSFLRLLFWVIKDRHCSGFQIQKLIGLLDYMRCS